MAFGGAVLRFGQTGLRLLEFASSAIILGIYSYFLAVLADKNIHIPTWEKAVEGMSGAAVLYTIFGVLFTLFLGGITFFALIAIILDLCFVGCFAAIAYYTRHGANKCRGIVNTPLGFGPDGEAAPGAGDWGYVCSLNTACFAMAILNIFLFLVTAIVQVLLARHHKKEKRFGPSPKNNYTKGTGRAPFWKRNKKVRTTRDAEMATGAGAGAGYRPSHETGMTGSTMHGGHAPYSAEPKYGQPGYGQNVPFNHQATNY
ncbi:hypothetical protein A1O7_08394 [Cladophialophora yegresii CBS 114405]|uniref:MARVEL domain-containing protein n=1 Tax=Cladophialophora yegresii CBS 114405 TaxID=1182544 RepID=W9VIG9_9EURO|nr:uncharacterized protein A1O7_08394 [Cladophialophora yegresii CBS 114405]EXJ55467.1 hypothetical protein A1O7_08394 [Cladophialophora yegresii CBS 114405]